MKRVIKKCHITGCLNLATCKPVVTVALSIKSSGCPVAPLTLAFDDGVCRDHMSEFMDDYVSDAQLMGIQFDCKCRGFLPHWNMMRVRFLPLGSKVSQGSKTTLDTVLAAESKELKWRHGNA